MYRFLDGVLRWILIVLTTVMVAAVSVLVIQRQIFNSTGVWLAPASQILLVWIGMLGGVYALRVRAHLGVDVFVRLYPRRVRVVLDVVSTLLVMLFSVAVLGVGGWMVCRHAIQSHSVTPGLEHFNRAWFYAVLPVAGILNLLYCLRDFFHPQPLGGESAEESPS